MYVFITVYVLEMRLRIWMQQAVIGQDCLSFRIFIVFERWCDDWCQLWEGEWTVSMYQHHHGHEFEICAIMTNKGAGDIWILKGQDPANCDLSLDLFHSFADWSKLCFFPAEMNCLFLNLAMCLQRAFGLQVTNLRIRNMLQMEWHNKFRWFLCGCKVLCG